ncbi:conserved protein of unknown function [Limnospira indica PCC 8005]|uniref:Uncharacterized protein n=1 Tax=Limnospira indica PCC 8005 TaxID=376219 RepID=A0A9P1KGU5_9CYAN|nr:conserved protein of unknown function [Limnospira indica PCC 8005]
MVGYKWLGTDHPTTVYMSRRLDSTPKQGRELQVTNELLEWEVMTP